MVEPQYYFDANALFKYYQDEKGDLKIRRLVANAKKPVLVSTEAQIIGYYGVQSFSFGTF